MDIYLGIGLILGLLTLLDGTRRKMEWAAVLWSLVVVFLWPVARGLYHVSKPLFAGESREGGAAWQVVRSTILWWTVLMGVISVYSLTSAASSTYATTSSGAGFLGATIGLGFGAGMFFIVWLVVVLVLFVISLAVKSNIIVQGPTGPLAEYGQGVAAPSVNVNVTYPATARFGAGNSTNELKQELSLIWTAYQRGERENARNQLQSIYRQRPNDPNVLYMVSVVVENPAKKIESLERALAIDPDYEPARKRLAELRRTGSFDADLM